MNNSENSDTTAPVFVFLPKCIESKNDVFSSIFRLVVNRSKLDGHPVEQSFVQGLRMESIQIESEDFGDWKMLVSTPQQIRQAMMLGFWTIQNYRSMGYKFCGDAWEVPLRKCVKVVGRQSMTPEEFDLFVFGKMKLRIIELNVSPTTLPRIKDFLKVPLHIGKENRVEITKKLFGHDIASGFDNQCWNFLRSCASNGSSSDVVVGVSFL